jgi:hypothetical protein
MGEGRTPGGVGADGATEGVEGTFDASSPVGARESAMLRLRKAISVILRSESRQVHRKTLEGQSISLALDVIYTFLSPLPVAHTLHTDIFEYSQLVIYISHFHIDRSAIVPSIKKDSAPDRSTKIAKHHSPHLLPREWDVVKQVGRAYTRPTMHRK